MVFREPWKTVSMTPICLFVFGTGYSDDLSVNSIKRGIYLTNVYYQKKENKTIVYVKSSAYVYISTLCIGMNGSLKLSHENNLDLPSDAIEIPIS